MNKLYLNDYLANLHRQISVSVEKIKQNSNTNRFSNNQSNSFQSFENYGLQNYAYNLLNSEVSYQLLNNNINLSSDNAYAAASYKSNGQILKEPTVLIDFMFKNNQEFDFKV